MLAQFLTLSLRLKSCNKPCPLTHHQNLLEPRPRPKHGHHLPETYLMRNLPTEIIQREPTENSLTTMSPNMDE